MNEAEREREFEEFKEKKKLKKAQMTAMQNLPYNIKVRRAESGHMNLFQLWTAWGWKPMCQLAAWIVLHFYIFYGQSV